MQLEHRTTKPIDKGSPFPLASRFSPTAATSRSTPETPPRFFLLLFDRPDGEPTDVVQLRERDKFSLARDVGGVKAGQLYGTKCAGIRPIGVCGSTTEAAARPVRQWRLGQVPQHRQLLLAYDAEPVPEITCRHRATARAWCQGIVIGRRLRLAGFARYLALEQLIIYEVHSKGSRTPVVRGPRAGTYLGFIEKIPTWRGSVSMQSKLLRSTSTTSTTSWSARLSPNTGATTDRLFRSDFVLPQPCNSGSQVVELKTWSVSYTARA
jgi:hypothetical protein